MTKGRWYPSTVTLGNGETALISGTHCQTDPPTNFGLPGPTRRRLESTVLAASYCHPVASGYDYGFPFPTCPQDVVEPATGSRNLNDQDIATSRNASAVISETMARRFWPNEDPVGKRFAAGRVTSDEDWINVVGVVKDVRQFELTAEPRPQMYLSYRHLY
jgi:hypothetical protein